MNEDIFIESVISWLVVFPSALLCIAPMHHCLKKSLAITIRNVFLVLVPLIIIVALLEAYFPLGFNTLTPGLLIIAFIAYHASLRVDIAKSLAVFFLVCTLMSFISNVSVLYDAALHPTLDIDHTSLSSTFVQLILSSVLTAILYYPMWRYGSRLIDRFNIRRVWITTLPILTVFIAYNTLTLPRKYETVHVNNVFIGMCFSLLLLFVLLVLLCAVFYSIVDGMIAASETRERNQFLEMQESHYLAVQRYMDETARVRHDFKHTIGALSDLAAQGDVDAVREYLDAYLESQPHSETTQYCSDTAVNALLNHYLHRATEQGIEIDLEVDLPTGSKSEPADSNASDGSESHTVGATSIASMDMCSMLGNILENAIIACGNVPESERYIDLLIRNDHDMLYLVASNSFDGKVRMKDGRYLSTHRHGQGIGLSSIYSTAGKYGGTVRFSHEAGEFRTDIVVPM